MDDLINGMVKLMNNDFVGPFNIGNPVEYKIIQLAELIRNKINPNLEFINKALPEDDPIRRKPNIELAINKLNWQPQVSLEEGLDQTISYFKNILGR